MDGSLFGPRTDADYEVVIERLLDDMRRLNQQMRDDQAEIDRLKAESRALKLETDTIKARINERLDAIARIMAASC